MYTSKVSSRPWKSPIEWKPANVEASTCEQSTKSVQVNTRKPSQHLCVGKGIDTTEETFEWRIADKALWKAEKNEATCNVLPGRRKPWQYGKTNFETYKAIHMCTTYRNLEVTDTLPEEFCYIQHIVSGNFITVRETYVYLAPLNHRNFAMFNRHYIAGYTDGHSVRMAMFSTYANCRPSHNFLSATRDGISVQEYRQGPSASNSFTARDDRVFECHKISGYVLFELASSPDHYIAHSSLGALTVKYVAQEHRDNDTDIQFRIRFPGTCVA